MIYFKFIGDGPSEKRISSFMVMVTEEENMRLKEGKRLMVGTVACSNNKAHRNGQQAAFVNPYNEMSSYGWPVFVKALNPEEA